MKVEYKLNDRVTVVGEGDTQLEVFETLATLEEVFGDRECGKCGSRNLGFRVRHVQDGKKEYTYPEMKCNECHAKLAYGQMEGGKLFPVRFERKDGEYVKVNDKNVPLGKKKDGKWSYGWVKFNKETNKEE